MKPSLLLPLLLLACASQAPSTLERGTFTRPPPAPARPGVGAPLVGQPVGPRTYIPSQPPAQRQLPRTEEPGLWSGEPRGASQNEAPPVQVIGVSIPLVPDARTIPDVLPTLRCAKHMQSVLEGADLLASALALSADERACLVARMYQHCMEYDLERVRKEMASRGVKLDPNPRFLDVLNTARMFKNEKCHKRSDTQAVERIGRKMRKKWADLDPMPRG